LPPSPPQHGALYIKHNPRSTMDIATVGVASVVALEQQSGVCQEIKIALGAVAPTVIQTTTAKALLRGQAVDPERLQQVAHATAQTAHPIDDIRGTAAHRRAVVAPLVQRTLHYAVQMAQETRLPFQTQRGLAVEAVF